jgi:hypothetical protein
VKTVIAWAALLAAPAAWAQGASDLPSTSTLGGAATLPTTETVKQPAPGQPGVYQPGGPSPVPAEAGHVTKAGDDKGPKGRYVYDNDSFESEGAPEPGEPSGAVPEVHVVKKGDTLWDISSQYFHNPWAWPKLWAYNPIITNPHWIYPGDVIHLAPAGGMPAPVAAAPTEKNELPTRGITRAGQAPELFLRQTGFAEPGELKAAGRIVGSKEEKIMLATLDEAYVQFPSDEKVRPGDRLTVYKSIRPLLHPVTRKRLGDIVQIFGEVEVKSITNGHIARVVVVDCTEDMQRGFRVGPLKRQFKMVEPRVSKQDLQGVVVDTLHPREIVGTETLVFVDRGKKDGVEIGNRFLVVRRGDGYQPLRDHGLPVDDKRFPRETIGEVLVLDVREAVSTGFVMHAAKEALIGDRVEEHKGY